MDDKHAPILQVPRIQRTYAWGKKQLEDFIKDLVHVSQDDDSEHYFGAFCTMRKSGDDNTELIIDGQQRIATSHLFLKHAQKIVVDSTLKDRINKIISVDNLKITLGRRDHETFKKIMRGETVDDKTSLLNKAYCHIGELLTQHNHNKVVVDKLVSTLLDRFRLVNVSLQHNKFGYTFHLVNYRGKQLTQSELIKSHIFIDLETDGGTTAADLDKLDEQWTEMSRNILTQFRNTGKPVDVFIQHVLSIKYGQINLNSIYEKFFDDLKIENTHELQHDGKIWLKNLFEWAERYIVGIKNNRTNPQDHKYGQINLNSIYEKFFDDLKIENTHELQHDGKIWLKNLFEWAERYMFLLAPSEQFSKPWKEGRLDAKRWLQRIKELKAVNIYPVLLAGYAKYYNTDPHSFYKLVDSCYRFHIRMITLGHLDVVTYTKFMQEMAHQIWTNKLATLNAVIHELNAYVIECEEHNKIRPIGTAISYIGSIQARHCLLLIEEYNYGVEKVANNPTVEHILPKKWQGSKWETYVRREYSDEPNNWIFNLGNMTLLSRSLNSEAKRKLFREKFKTYNSNYGITQELKKQKSWNTIDIEERCDKYEKDLGAILDIAKYPVNKHSIHQ